MEIRRCKPTDLVVILLFGAVLWPATFLLEKPRLRLTELTVQNMPESSSRNSPSVREKQSKFDFNCAVDLTPVGTTGKLR